MFQNGSTINAVATINDKNKQKTFTLLSIAVLKRKSAIGSKEEMSSTLCLYDAFYDLFFTFLNILIFNAN
jgi:hypothetical protein